MEETIRPTKAEGEKRNGRKLSNVSPTCHRQSAAVFTGTNGVMVEMACL